MLVIVVEEHKIWGSGMIRYIGGTLEGLPVKRYEADVASLVTFA